MSRNFSVIKGIYFSKNYQILGFMISFFAFFTDQMQSETEDNTFVC